MKLRELFDIKYGGSFSKISDYKSGTTPVIKSQGTNNGVIAFLDIEPNYSHVITVARTGSVGASFYHSSNCYVTDDCMVLQPLQKLSKEQMLLYATIISKEKHKFNYSRKVTPERLKNTNVPSVESIDKWVSKINFPKQPSNKAYKEKKIGLHDKAWSWFEIKRIFEVNKGKRLTKEDQTEGNIPYISSSSLNNGVDNYIGNGYTDENCLSFACYGSIGEVFYHNGKVWVSDNANVLYLKERELNPFLALFLATVLSLEKFRFSYGMTGKKERIKTFKIKLPIDKNGNPDWQFMEDYIKSLPYSINIKDMNNNKGLTDEQLIAKYEAGKVDLSKAANKMFQPSPTATKSEKQTKKR